LPTASNFALKEWTPPALVDGMIRVRNRWLSVDPHMRSRMDAAQPFVKSYYPPYVVGEPLEGAGLGEIIESRAEGFAPGDLVGHYQGWREESVVHAATAAWKIATEGVPEHAFIGVLGHTGATAYFGLRKIEPKAGDILFVSGAAGAVGSTVVQLAKAKGMTVIGSTGGAQKCALVRELGADATVDYKAGPVLAQLEAVAPDGIDAYFDNVGGDHLDAAIAVARPHARFSLLGTIENYNSGKPAELRYLLNVVSQRIRIEGVVATDYIAEFPTFRQDVIAMIKDGRIVVRDTIREGLEAMPQAFFDLFTGLSAGKMVVKL
jgi:NADPH-dependent curcumin reductase CurA